MNEFNPFSLLNKIIKDVSRITNPKGAPVQNAQNVNPAPNPFGAQMQNVNLQNTLRQSVDFYTLQAQTMEHAQLLNYMKESLNLPKEIKDLITQVIQKQGQARGDFLSAKFDLAEFGAILSANAKDATQKIIQAMAEFSKQGVKDVSQLKELLILIGASVTSASADNNQALKNLLLLYLPFLPINQNSKDFDFEVNKKQKEAGGGEDDCIEVLIKTKNYGNIRAVLTKEQNRINIFVQCTEAFPSQMFLKLIEDEAQNHAIQTSVNFSKIKQEEKDAADVPAQSVQVNNSNTLINSAIMLVLHFVIKIIFEIDNSN